MKRVFFVLVVAVFLLMATVAGASAHGKGNNPAALGDAGWTCVYVPGLGVHCFPPGADLSGNAAAVTVKVYDTDDPEDDHAPFEGTELLLHPDVYEQGNGHGWQPCIKEDREDYQLVVTPFGPYYACHHYSH